LLAPERFALPVPSHWLRELLEQLGFDTDVRHFPIQGAASFCLAATNPPPVMPRCGFR
jgi:hypothetical protein